MSQAEPAIEARAAEDSAGGLTTGSAEIRALLVLTFLFPIAMCGVFFPTPAGDLREHINYGLNYRLYVFYAPPLQTWLAGAVALTGARDSWSYVAVAQLLNFAGLFYLVLTARRFFGAGTTIPLVIMFCGSLYYAAATPSMALNSDQLQVPLWAGIVFHGLTALHDNRWRDWIACGVLIGFAIIAKYTVLVFIAAILVALVLVPSYRGVFSNPRLYIAGLVSLPVVALHVVPELSRGYSVQYAAGQFWLTSIEGRLGALWQLARSYVLYGAVPLAGLAVLAWRDAVTVLPFPQTPAARFNLLVVLLYLACIVVMIGFGLNYATRYTYPIFGLSLLALLSVIRIAPEGMKPFAVTTLRIWGAILVGALVYSQVAIHRVQREPAPAAASALREIWDSRFGCGPAYVIGNDLSARGVAIYYGKPVTGLHFESTTRADWLDNDRLRQLGAIVVTTPAFAAQPQASQWFKGRATDTLSFPYRRSFSAERHTYVYAVIPPQDCPAAAK
jgi:hypothetical protein